uniref:Transmembrane protein 100 n=1 Tax=Anabas testudineus TaxID=64144 RepID=A0A3Q1H0K6_ANATE
MHMPASVESTNIKRDGSVGREACKIPESLPTLERLAQATGGTEKSWYRCVFPFGVISLVIGMAGTGVTFTFNTLLQTKVVSVALLCVGIIMLLVAALCWRAHRLRRRKKKEARVSQAIVLGNAT